MFSSLKIRDYRIYWAGMFISLIGTWIQTVAQSWLVYELTASAFLLGVVGFLGALPIFFFSLFGGVFADRINKRTILLCTQNAFMALAFLLAALTYLQLIRPWHIMVIAALNGLVMAFDAPTRQAMVVELVGKEHLLNAIALNSAAFNSARIIGPAIAGILVAAIGMSGCFLLNAISFLAVITALASIKLKGLARSPSGANVWRQLIEGLEFIRGHKTILILISIVGISSFFGISYMILMPLFADEILHVGAKGLGMLMSSSGAGALAAALILARLDDFRHKGKLLIFSLLVFSLGLTAFSLSKSYLFSLGMLVVIGWGTVTAMSLVNTLLQTLVPDEFRGRVMSGFMLTFAGVLPFGNLLGGSLAHRFGAALAVCFSGIVCSIAFISVFLKYPEIRRL